MIPLQLKIRNFLSYGPQGEPIDFEPHHLICLTGKNGHGKSALLDAITWALWGQARKISGLTRGDEHLIRLGQSGMTVTLDFSCNNQRYRVTRDFSIALNRKGLTQLHLGLFREDLDAYVSLSEKNIRDTQEKLDAIIGLDYDTFINSVFLRQGQANEFSKKSPLERKEILSALLGLSRYEELRKRALEQQRIYEKEHEIVGHLTKSLTDELGAKQDVLAQAKTIEQEIAGLTKTEKELADRVAALTIRQQQITETQTALALATQSLDQHARIYGQQHENLVNLLHQRQIYQRRTKNLDSGQLRAAHETILKKLADYDILRSTQMALKEKFLAISSRRQEHHKLLQAELQVTLQTATTQLNQTKLDTERAENSLTNSTQKRTTIEAQQKILVTKKLELEQTLTQQEHVNRTVRLLEEQIAREIRFADKWQLLAQQGAEAHTRALMRCQNLTIHNSVCPLCTQALTQEHRVMLVRQAKETARLQAHQSARLEKILKKLNTQIRSHAVTQKQLAGEREQMLRRAHELGQVNELLSTHERELPLLIKQVVQAQEQMLTHTQQLSQAQKRYDIALSALKTVPAEDPVLCACTQEIIAIEEQIKRLEQTAGAISETALREELTRINEQLKAVTLMGHEREQNRKRSGEIRGIIQELRINRHEQKVLKKTITDLSPLVNELIANSRLLQNIRKELDLLQQKKQLLFEQKGSLSRQLVIFEKRSQELISNQNKIKELASLIEDHQLLAQALSKNGIQALIIEQAVPELESEANTLLARLTDNQAQVMFESLRDLKSGGSKETLDIKISDAMGTRPYELFSGGEAFRIDFALRIALSKLLARRSGTTLQTLIIDEGFGSQDEEGLALIQEAIHAIQEDFEKIIIVSHLPAMKHQFPTNFVIRKGTDGSTVTVVEQG